MADLWTELLILQTIIGYCFVIANACIGLYNIRDLNRMKGDITIVRAHKWIGRIETIFFIVVTIQCILMIPMFPTASLFDSARLVGYHTIYGGIIASILFGTKAVIAYGKKDVIYKYGQYLGPMGFVGWSIAFFTGIQFLDWFTEEQLVILPKSYFWAIFVPIITGLMIFFGVLAISGTSKKENRFSVHQIAFILHGITFGYERAARDLLGAPALSKYVVPQTYVFLEKMMGILGLDLKELEKMNVNDAMNLFMKKAATIKMAEKIKIDWEKENIFTVESINCSTSRVRSAMSKEDLNQAVCPWAIMAATIVGRITGKNLEIEPSEFNEIGAKTRLTIKES